MARQRTFLQDWFFICGCCRCRDPSEFGTNLSSVKCGVCSKGFVIPPPPTVAGENEETSNFNQKIRLGKYFKIVDSGTFEKAELLEDRFSGRPSYIFNANFSCNCCRNFFNTYLVWWALAGLEVLMRQGRV